MHSIFLENLFLAQIKVLYGYFFLYIYLTNVSRSCQGVFNGKYDIFTLLFFFKEKKKDQKSSSLDLDVSNLDNYLLIISYHLMSILSTSFSLKKKKRLPL
jgi:hypothetical protein